MRDYDLREYITFEKHLSKNLVAITENYLQMLKEIEQITQNGMALEKYRKEKQLLFEKFKADGITKKGYSKQLRLLKQQHLECKMAVSEAECRFERSNFPMGIPIKGLKMMLDKIENTLPQTCQTETL